MNEPTLITAARFKGQHSISLADSMIAGFAAIGKIRIPVATVFWATGFTFLTSATAGLLLIVYSGA